MLVSPDATLSWHSSFDTQIGSLWDFQFEGCSPSAMSEALGVVAVRFDCRRDRRGGLTLDFAVCGNRIRRVDGDESGYLSLSPLPRRLAQEVWRRVLGEPSLCP